MSIIPAALRIFRRASFPSLSTDKKLSLNDFIRNKMKSLSKLEIKSARRSNNPRATTTSTGRITALIADPEIFVWLETSISLLIAAHGDFIAAQTQWFYPSCFPSVAPKNFVVHFPLSLFREGIFFLTATRRGAGVGIMKTSKSEGSLLGGESERDGIRD